MKDLEERYGRKVTKTEDIMLYGKKYSKITFEDGEAILRRWDDEYKMWVTLWFTQDKELSKRVVEELPDIIAKNLSLN